MHRLVPAGLDQRIHDHPCGLTDTAGDLYPEFLDDLARCEADVAPLDVACRAVAPGDVWACAWPVPWRAVVRDLPDVRWPILRTQAWQRTLFGFHRLTGPPHVSHMSHAGGGAARGLRDLTGTPRIGMVTPHPAVAGIVRAPPGVVPLPRRWSGHSCGHGRCGGGASLPAVGGSRISPGGTGPGEDCAVDPVCGHLRYSLPELMSGMVAGSGAGRAHVVPAGAARRARFGYLRPGSSARTRRS